MRDELELLRAANPVPADEGRWRDRLLDATAERGLNRLLHQSRTRRARRRLVLRAEAAVLALVAVLAFTLTDAGSSPAVAAPPPWCRTPPLPSPRWPGSPASPGRGPGRPARPTVRGAAATSRAGPCPWGPARTPRPR
ncbi:hypothetical protein DC74_2814 [Streptomyces noursei]|nr:hypothetical protein DC74_2814 [Streptomyces noursei]